MRTLIAAAASLLCSVAFQLTLLFYPTYLRPYAWLVKWLWMASVLLGLIWLLGYPRVRAALWGDGPAAEPKDQERNLANVPADPSVGPFSPLQVEVFQLAKDMRSFLKDSDPIPPADYGGSQKMKSVGERINWRRRLESMYHLNFDDRLKAVELKLGANKIRINHAAIDASSKRGIEEYIARKADVLTAMAHRLDGVVLDVKTDVGA